MKLQKVFEGLKISWWGYHVSNIASKESQKENSVYKILCNLKLEYMGVLDMWILFQRITSIW